MAKYLGSRYRHVHALRRSFGQIGVEAQLDEAIERFEVAVEAHGRDLMMDEAPRGSTPQPDNPRFALPRRGEHESMAQYLEQLARATADVRKQPPRAG